MRWEPGATTNSSPPPGDLAALADLVRAADNARLSRDEDGLAASSQRINNILADTDSLEQALPLAAYREVLVVAFHRWAQYGTADPQPGDPAGQLLENIRLGLAAIPSWLRAVLGALGLSWPAMAG